MSHIKWQRYLILYGLFFLAMSLPATAATYTWDTSTTDGFQAGNGNWSTSAADVYWAIAPDTGTTLSPWTDGSDAVFSAGGTSAITLDTVTANSLTFNATGYTISGGTLTLSNTTTSDYIVNQDATINSALAGTFTEHGTGTLYIGGGLTVTNNTTPYRPAIADVSNSTGKVVQTGGTVSIGNYLMVGGNSAGSATNCNGTYEIDDGILSVSLGIYAGWNSSTNAGTIIQNGGTVSLPSTTQSLQLGIGGGTGSYYLNGGTLTAKINNSAAGHQNFYFGGGTYQDIASTNYSTWSGLVTQIQPDKTAIIDTNGGTVTWTGAIIGANANTSLQKIGTGTLVLQGTNTWGNATNLNAGTLKITNNGNLGASTATINFNGGMLDFSSNTAWNSTSALAAARTVNWSTFNGGIVVPASSNFTFDTPISGTGSLYLGGSLATIYLNAHNTHSGGTTIGYVNGSNGMTVVPASADVFGTGTISTDFRNASGYYGGAINANGLTFTNAFVLNGSGIKGGGGVFYNTSATTAEITGPITLGKAGQYIGNASLTANDNIIFSNVVSGTQASGAYSLFKQGPGTLTLSNPANTFQGYTYIAGGTLAVTKLGKVGEDSSLGNPPDSASNYVKFYSPSASYTGGTLKYIGDTASITDRQLVLCTAKNILDASGTTPEATVTFTENPTVPSGSPTLTLTGTNTGENSFNGSIGGAISIIKNGTGKWVLGSTNYYSGPTLVNSGTLALSSSGLIVNSPTIEVKSGATFDVSAIQGGFMLGAQNLKGGGAVVGSVIGGIGAQITPGSSAGTMTISGNLTLNGGEGINFELASTPSGASDLIAVGGDLAITGALGPTNLNLSLLGSSLANGNYPVFTCAGTLAPGSAANLTVSGALLSTRQTITPAADDSVTPKQIYLKVEGHAADLAWKGSENGIENDTWDLKISKNWDKSGTPDMFYSADSVTFDDTAAFTNVYLSDSLVPGSVTVNTAGTYTFTGYGSIVGAANLVKKGTGTLNVLTLNTYSGGTSIQAGTVQLGDGLSYAGSLGTGTIDIQAAGSLIFNLPADGTVDNYLSGAGSMETRGASKLTLTASSDFAGTLTISGGTLQIGNGGTTGSLGTGAIINKGTLIINRGNEATFVNDISDVGIVQIKGPGPITLSGNNTYSGGTEIFSLSPVDAVVKTGSSTAFGTGNVKIDGATHGSAVDLNGYTLAVPFELHGAGPNGGKGTLINTSGTTAEITAPITFGKEGEYIGSLDAVSNDNIVFSGILSGAQAVNTYQFLKQGPGTLTITNKENTYQGFTYIAGGTLAVTKLGLLGETSSLGQATDATNNAIKFYVGFGRVGGTLKYIGDTPSITDRQIVMASELNAIDASGITGDDTLTLTASVSGAGDLTLTGSNLGDNTLQGDLGGPGSLIKNGTGKWVLAGVKSYTGNTIVNAGTLAFDEIVNSTNVIVNQGELTGHAIQAGNITVLGGTLDADSLVCSTLTIGAGTAGENKSLNAVPEPSTLLLLAVAGLATVGMHFRRK